MAVRQILNPDERQLLEVGDENANMEATINRDLITEAAGEVAKSIGDRLNLKPEVQRYQNERQRSSQTSWSSKFIKVIDTTLKMLEDTGQSANLDAKKLEQILRALYKLTEMGDNAQLCLMMKIASAFLNNDSDPYPSERQYIMDCFEATKEHQASIVRLVEEASRLIEVIVESEGVDYLTGRKFDNVFREAKTKIDLCRGRLKRAEKAIYELAEKMNIRKWASRVMRGAGCVFTTGVIFKKYQESSRSWWNMLQYGGLAFIVGGLWMCLLSRGTYVFYESVANLEFEHRKLEDKLEELHICLTSAKDHRDGPLLAVQR